HPQARTDRGGRQSRGHHGALQPRYAGAGVPRRRARPLPGSLGRQLCGDDEGRAGGVPGDDAMSDVAVRHGISPRRIGAVILRYWYLLVSSWPRLLELAYWPVLQVVTWGFLQTYIAQNANFFARAGGTLIGAVILWDILFRGQLGFSISFLEEMWARNLGNLMMSPL